MSATARKKGGEGARSQTVSGLGLGVSGFRVLGLVDASGRRRL